MEIVIENITESNLRDIPKPCRGCLYWEFPEEFEKINLEKSEEKTKLAVRKKKEWFTKTLNEFGNCGKIVYCEGAPVGYAQYGPSAGFPRIKEYPAGPVGNLKDGVVFISCLFVSKEALRKKRMGTRLLRSIIEDLKARGFKAVETFARRSNANNPSGPLEFYLKHGFYIKNERNHEFPLVRVEL